jgi:hypothetical protein
LAINPDLVTDVLLADGWHKVAPGAVSGFTLAPYSFGEDGRAMPRYEEGFILFERQKQGKATRYMLAGPLSSVLAVRYKVRGPKNGRPHTNR